MKVKSFSFASFFCLSSASFDFSIKHFPPFSSSPAGACLVESTFNRSVLPNETGVAGARLSK